MRHTGLELLDGELSCLATPANGLVHPAIGSTADESNNLIAVDDPNFALVSNIWTDAPVRRI